VLPRNNNNLLLVTHRVDQVPLEERLTRRRLSIMPDLSRRTLEIDSKLGQERSLSRYGLLETMEKLNGQKMLSLCKPMVMSLELYLSHLRELLDLVKKLISLLNLQHLNFQANTAHSSDLSTVTI
jgi:hypothetical protein